MQFGGKLFIIGVGKSEQLVSGYNSMTVARATISDTIF